MHGELLGNKNKNMESYGTRTHEVSSSPTETRNSLAVPTSWRHLQATSADLGRFLVGGGVFWGRAFGPNGPIRRAGPIGAIPRVLITDGPSRYGSIDTSLLYPRLGVPSFFTHSTQMIDLAGL